LRSAGLGLVLALALWAAGVPFSCPEAFALQPPDSAPSKSAAFSPEELEPLLSSLEAIGFDRQTIDRVFYDERLRKIDRIVTINAINPDSASSYEQFTSPYAIHLARRFRRRHGAELRQVEREYGVPEEIIVAILLVETQFGRAKLPFRVLEVFTTLAVEGDPRAVERHYDRIRQRNPEIGKEWLASRLMDKAQFAFAELVAVLEMFRENVQHLYEVRGSYAGAIGIPQFLPSSYLEWAVDGDGDGSIDLDNLSDAMPSVANYLRSHGWTEQAPFRDQWRAVWEYNHSGHYVRTIFEIALRLSTPRKPRHR
jgi:membrane-bound lytic murein transglycosylase B